MKEVAQLSILFLSVTALAVFTLLACDETREPQAPSPASTVRDGAAQKAPPRPALATTPDAEPPPGGNRVESQPEPVREKTLDELTGVDVSQSHVIGREWHQIDYSGEPMTWQSQKAAWEPLGVVNFKEARFLETYFKIVSKMAFFKRVYQPGGTLPP